MQDFITRVQHFAALSTIDFEQLRVAGVWIGGFCQPEAFITAMRQQVARRNDWSVEKVSLLLLPLAPEEFEKKDAILAEHPNAFLVHGMMLEGACWDADGFAPSDDNRYPLDEVLFEWRYKEADSDSEVSIPIYLNESRADLLYVVDVKQKIPISVDVWRTRAVAIIAWRQS